MHILYRAMLSGVRYTQEKCVFKTNYILKKYTWVRYTFSSNHNAFWKWLIFHFLFFSWMYSLLMLLVTCLITKKMENSNWSQWSHKNIAYFIHVVLPHFQMSLTKSSYVDVPCFTFLTLFFHACWLMELVRNYYLLF